MERKSDQSNALGCVMVALLVPFGAHLCSPTATSCCLFSFCLLLMFVSPQAQLTESWSPVFSLSFLSHLRVRPHSHMSHPSCLFLEKSPNMSKHETISEQLSLLLIPPLFSTILKRTVLLAKAHLFSEPSPLTQLLLLGLSY